MWKSKRFNIKSWFRNNRELATLPFVLVVVFALMAGLAPSRFLKGSNFQSMAIQLPEVGLFALAMMITLLTGGINLSVITTAYLRTPGFRPLSSWSWQLRPLWPFRSCSD
jgi:simple sugar transport system permease protein